MDYNLGKARIMDALLEHRGLQFLVDVGADVLGNPIFVCDLAAQVLALSHSTGKDRAFWEDFFPEGKMDPQNASDVGRAGIYEQVFSSDAPVTSRFDFYPGRFIGARIRLRDDVIGMATVVERNELGPHDGDLLVILCQAIVMEMTWQDSGQQASSALLEVVASAIEGTATGSELDLRAQGARLTLPSFARVLVIGLEAGHFGILFPFLRSRLEQLFPTSPAVVWHGRLVMLLDLERHADIPLHMIQSCFAGLPIRIGAGCTFDRLDGIGPSYRQARSAMMLAQQTGYPAILADYDDWRVEDFVAQAARVLDLDEFEDPAMARMAAHDQHEGTQLVETLDAYLRCANNAQAAARLLGIHKNTMYARLERIQQLFDVDLEGGET